MVRVLRAFAVLVAAAGAAASEKSEGGQPSNSQLAELQDQLQHAIDQQGQLSDQQAALTDALAPLLTWANNIAPQNTGCDLDHYTSIISLCGAEGSEKADLDAQGEATVSETDSGCECMDTWYYDGTRYTGCQVTEPPPGSKMHFPPWCVVSGGCTNAHPGPWGAWGHCTQTTNWTNSDWGTQWHSSFRGGPMWVTEPQALFSAGKPTSSRYSRHSAVLPLDTYCADATCRYALMRLKDQCTDTRDPVMQELVGLISAAPVSCANVSQAPPPPPPGSHTYHVTVTLNTGDSMEPKAVTDVVATMLGCPEQAIQDLQPTGVEGTYSFVLVSANLHKTDIDRLLEPVGTVTTTSDMQDETSSFWHAHASDYSDHSSGDQQNGVELGDSNIILVGFGLSTIGTLAALSFCGVVGKVRKLSAGDDVKQFEMSAGEPLMRQQQRYVQPLLQGSLSTPERYGEAAHPQYESWMLLQYNDDDESDESPDSDGLAGGWAHEGGSNYPRPTVSWGDSPSMLTESDDGGSGTPDRYESDERYCYSMLDSEQLVEEMDSACLPCSASPNSTLPQEEVINSGYATDSGGSGGIASDGGGAAALALTAGGSSNSEEKQDGGSNSNSGSSSDGGTPDVAIPMATPVQALQSGAGSTAALPAVPVEHALLLPEAERVAELERQLAEAQGDLMAASLRRYDHEYHTGAPAAGAGASSAAAGGLPPTTGMSRPVTDVQHHGHVKVETTVYYDGGGGGGGGGGDSGVQQQWQQQHRHEQLPDYMSAMALKSAAATSAASSVVLEPRQPPQQPMLSTRSTPKRKGPPTPTAATTSHSSGARARSSAPSRMGAATAARPYPCTFPGCNYAASQKRYLSDHVRVHTGARPFHCPWEGCDYAASGSGHMSRHMRVHTGDRPYKCMEPGCGYAASQSGHLRTHMRKHTGERPFKCPVADCDYAAARPGHLTRHMKVHEPGGRGRGRPPLQARSLADGRHQQSPQQQSQQQQSQQQQWGGSDGDGDDGGISGGGGGGGGGVYSDSWSISDADAAHLPPADL